MRVLIQRVVSARVAVENTTVGEIERGLVVFLGVGHGDSLEDVDYLAAKIAGLRIFSDKDGKMNLSAQDVDGGILVISQFTLYGDCRKGRRPSFDAAAPPDLALSLYNAFCNSLVGLGLHIQTGEFGAHMLVEINNDGPVTFFLDSNDRR